MSNISSKISSIEPDDSGSSASGKLGLRPADSDFDAITLNEPDPVPAFISRRDSSPGLDVDNNTGLWSRIFPFLAGTIWIIGAVLLIHLLFNLGTAGSNLTPSELAALGLLVIAPACLIIVTIIALQKLSHLTKLAAHLGQTTHTLLMPDDSAKRRGKEMAGTLQSEVDQFNDKIDQAISRLDTLGEVLTEHSDQLGRSTYATEEKTEIIATRLSTEREALFSMAKTFDDRMNALSKMLGEHAEKLSNSTQLAETKIDEARISVEGAAEKINSASDIVRNNTVEAADTLESNHKELIDLGDALKTRANSLDEVFSKHISDLKSMVSDLRGDQESLSIALEEQVRKMRDMSLSAQVSSERLFDASAAGKQTVEALSNASQLAESAIKQRFAEMEDMVSYSTSKAETISDKAARRVQQSLSQTREEIARIEADMIDLQKRMERTTVKASPESNPKELPTDSDYEAPSLRTERGALNLMPVDQPSYDLDEVSEAADPEEVAFPEPQDSSSSSTEPLSLKIETPDIAQQPIIDPEEDILRRTVPDMRRSTRQETENKPWWRSIIPGRENSPETMAIDRITARDDSNQYGDIILTLAQMGLSPGAIIDDGCILEASDTRMAQGANAMSASVARRITDPVNHLKTALASDPELQAKLAGFAAEFHNSLEQGDKHRDVYRAKFEKDAGRAFLICDAALNT